MNKILHTTDISYLNEKQHIFKLDDSKFHEMIDNIIDNLLNMWNNTLSENRIQLFLDRPHELYVKYKVKTYKLIKSIADYVFYFHESDEYGHDAMQFSIDTNEKEWINVNEIPLYIQNKGKNTIKQIAICITINKNIPNIKLQLHKILSHELLHIEIAKESNLIKETNGLSNYIVDTITKNDIGYCPSIDDLNILINEQQNRMLDNFELVILLLGCIYYLDESEINCRIDSTIYDLKTTKTSDNIRIYENLYKLLDYQQYDLNDILKYYVDDCKNSSDDYNLLFNNLLTIYLKETFPIRYNQLIVNKKKEISYLKLINYWKQKCIKFQKQLKLIKDQHNI